MWSRLFKLTLRANVTVEEILPELEGEYITDRTVSGSNLLHFAALNYDNENIACFLIEQVPSLLKSRNHADETPLHWACKVSPLSVIKHMVYHGSDVNAADEFGATSLHWSAEFDRPEVIEFLLSAGASLKYQNEDFLIPYDIALNNQISEAAISLLRPSYHKPQLSFPSIDFQVVL